MSGVREQLGERDEVRRTVITAGAGQQQDWRRTRCAPNGHPRRMKVGRDVDAIGEREPELAHALSPGRG
jgi:hypothetical protein